MCEPAYVLMSRRLIAVIGLCALAACAGPPPGEKLTAAQLKTEIPDHTAIGETDRGTAFTVYYAPNGKFVIKLPDQRDTGNYRITPENELCVKFDTAFNGDEYCYTFYKQGKTFRAVDSSGSVATSTMSEGNSQNL